VKTRVLSMLKMGAGVILVLATLAGCLPSIEELEAVYYTPLAREDWVVSTPEAQGLDPMLVAELYYYAGKMETLYSLLVVVNGHLIAERYFNEGSIDQKARLQSATKSFTSALVAIALEQGHLSSVDQKMLEFFPEVAGEVTDSRKEQITIRHLLQMLAGYPWEETHADLWAGLLSGYYVPLIEAFPLVSDPGTAFHYSNLHPIGLGSSSIGRVVRTSSPTARSICSRRWASSPGSGARTQRATTMAAEICT
jgi:CubicO group peptidase (beta-lactamase class C family)